MLGFPQLFISFLVSVVKQHERKGRVQLEEPVKASFPTSEKLERLEESA